MPGPPPKDPSQRRRRNATPGFKLLPHQGRLTPIPKWPLSATEDSEQWEREMARWRELWTLPQAVEWERMRCFLDVAIYVRLLSQLEVDPEDTKLSSELRAWDAKIGHSPKAMRDLRWEIDEPEIDEEPGTNGNGNGNGKRRAYVPKDAKDD